MSVQDKVNILLKNIFSDSSLVEIICSLYEREMSGAEVASFLGMEEETIAAKLDLLVQSKLIRHKEKEGKVFYTSANSKVCDSLLSLKDALYNLSGTGKE